VNIETDSNGSLVVWRIDASGGAGGGFGNLAGSPGSGGQVVINGVTLPGVTLPEATSLVTLSVGLATVAGLAWRQRKAKLAA
jgi:hypothetical protein